MNCPSVKCPSSRDPGLNRRSFLWGMASLASTLSLRLDAFAAFPAPDPGFRLVDATVPSGIRFRHNNGAYGSKLLPETLGAGCAFLDYDRDGWQDIDVYKRQVYGANTGSGRISRTSV